MKYIVTFDNDDLNQCYGVFDTMREAIGCVFDNILRNDDEFKVKLVDDEGYDAWVELQVTFHREGEGYNFDFTDRYRIFKLEEEEK